MSRRTRQQGFEIGNRAPGVALLLALYGAGCGGAELGDSEGTDDVTATAALRAAPGIGDTDPTIGTPPPDPVDPAPTRPVFQTTRYYLIDIGPADNSPAPHLNQNGAAIWNANRHAFLYQNCRSTDLGWLGDGTTIANGINNAGDVVGKALVHDAWHAFLYSNGSMRDLGGASGFTYREEAIAINVWGEVAGTQTFAGDPLAVRFQGGVAVPMASFMGLEHTGVVDMNDSGFVVGYQTVGGTMKALFSNNYGNQWRQVLGVPGLDAVTQPRAENAYGHIVGRTDFWHAFVSPNPDVPAIDLGTLGGAQSAADGINNHGTIVGWALPSAGEARAFLHEGGVMVDLNTRLIDAAGYLLLEAHAINDAGQIVAKASHAGQTRVVFLQPTAKVPTAAPCGGVAGGFDGLAANG